MTSHEKPFRDSTAIRLLPGVGLAVLGLLVTHETAYSLATWLAPVVGGDGDGRVDHTHQSLLIAAAGPPALWATAWFVLRQLRRLRLTSMWGATPLSGAIAGLYLIQETIEIAIAGAAGPGLGGLIANRAIPIGLLLAPLVAWLLLRVLDRAEDLILAWLGVPPATAPGRRVPPPRTRSTTISSDPDRQPGDPRGPPVRDVTTVQLSIS